MGAPKAVAIPAAVPAPHSHCWHPDLRTHASELQVPAHLTECTVHRLNHV